MFLKTGAKAYLCNCSSYLRPVFCRFEKIIHTPILAWAQSEIYL